MRTRPVIRPFHDPRDGLPTISNPLPGPWHDPLLIRTKLIEKDIIGLDPRYNWFTPFDFTPVGAYTKAQKGVKGFRAAYQLFGYGLGRFGIAKLAEAGSDFVGLGSKLYGMLSDSKESPGQDMTLPGSPGRQIPKTPGGTKSSRGAKSPQTLKPFWSNGKPKCRKGYRYDFKRKMCVKKS